MLESECEVSTSFAIEGATLFIDLEFGEILD
jgi:hypothetical protein